jgi:hypothetical protein
MQGVEPLKKNYNCDLLLTANLEKKYRSAVSRVLFGAFIPCSKSSGMITK